MRRLALTLLALTAAVSGLNIAPNARAEARPTPHLAPSSAPKSEFNFRPGFTKDPFYPRSLDVPPPPPPTNHQATKIVRSQSFVPDSLALKGISNTNRKLAIINNRTVGEGEDFTVMDGGKSVVVRCVEIKEQSVVVSVSGTTKELSLRVK